MLRIVSLVFLTLVLLLAFTLRGWGQRGNAAQQTPDQRIVITGSSTMAPLISEIAKRFESVNPGVRVDVQTGGSSRGVADARNGAADIGMASRSLKPDETDLIPHLVAHDGIGMITHRDNPVTGLTDRQVRDVYLGELTNWKQLGGPDASIVVVNKAEGRATLELFLNYFVLKNSDIEAHVVIGDNEQGIKTVAGNPYAIGYVSIGAAEYNARAGVPIRLLAANGVEASLATVGAGDFPITRELNLLTREAPSGLVKAFIDYARSPRVRDLVESFYFVPLDE